MMSNKLQLESRNEKQKAGTSVMTITVHSIVFCNGAVDMLTYDYVSYVVKIES